MVDGTNNQSPVTDPSLTVYVRVRESHFSVIDTQSEDVTSTIQVGVSSASAPSPAVTYVRYCRLVAACSSHIDAV